MKVAIVGAAKASQMDAPFDDEEWEIWVLGNQITDYNGKRVSRIFELHDNLSQHPPEYPQFLVDLGIKMVVGDRFPVKHENVEVYPYEEVDELWGYHYQTSSASYMVGYAINLIADEHISTQHEIAIYGINMAVDNHEYYKQRNCFEAWLGFAKGLGIKITIPESSPILKSNYDEARDWNNKKDSPFFEQNLLDHAEKHKEVSDHLKMKAWKHEGAQEVYESLAKIARGVDAGQPMELLELNDKV